MLGERFPKKRQNFFCPKILDEPALLRKLYWLDPERFVRLVLLEPTLFWEVSEKARDAWRDWYDR